MDPVSVGLLTALASSAGGELGRQAWAGLRALVHRPFRPREGSGRTLEVSSGAAELAELEGAPSDSSRAQSLSIALAVRAALDPDFRVGLEQWQQQAQLARTGGGAVTNTINGGTQHGPVLQGRDFFGLSFNPSPPTAAPGVSPSQQS